jgi:hypothetical protein
MSENYYLSGKNARYDLEIVASRFFRKFRSLAVIDQAGEILGKFKSQLGHHRNQEQVIK